jgi:hypothetical protein
VSGGKSLLAGDRAIRASGAIRFGAAFQTKLWKTDRGVSVFALDQSGSRAVLIWGLLLTLVCAGLMW